jgi:hypothetical protein
VKVAAHMIPPGTLAYMLFIILRINVLKGQKKSGYWSLQLVISISINATIDRSVVREPRIYKSPSSCFEHCKKSSLGAR